MTITDVPTAVDSTAPTNTPLSSLELFAGAGGLALGVHFAGFSHVGLVEKDEIATQTLRQNAALLGIHQDKVLEGNASGIDYRLFQDKVDLLSGGPPCQPFSMGGQDLGPDDERNMFPLFFEVIATVRPKAILIENVRGLLREKFQDYFRYILKGIRFPLVRIKEGESWQQHFARLLRVSENDYLDSEKYRVTHQLVDTADFGVPQRRERVIITAFREDQGIDTFQVPTTHDRKLMLISQLETGTYWKRHGIQFCTTHLSKKDLSLLAALQTSLDLPAGKESWMTVRDALAGLPDPVIRGQTAVLANHVQHPGARIYTGHLGSHWDYPAKALKAGNHGTPGGENVLRVTPGGETVRYFTIREAARLHTFPDAWHFSGSWASCIRQLGNAVPVKIGTIFASEIYRRLTALTVSNNRCHRG